MNGTIAAAITAADAVVGYLGQRAIDSVVDKFAAAVIRPCAERRAHAYFHQLADSLKAEASEEHNEEVVRAALDRVMCRDSARETVFEYYRKAVFSRSQEVGPRLLALLTARLLGDQRAPTATEHQIAEIAEACTDEDLAQFLGYVGQLSLGHVPKGAKRVEASGNEIVVEMGTDSGRSVFVSALNLSVELGAWAAKFERAGAITQYVETGSVPREIDSAHTYDWNPPVRHFVHSSVTFGEACIELTRLIPLVGTHAN